MNYDQERSQLINHFNEMKKNPEENSDHYILELFHFQYKYNKIYNQYCSNLRIKLDQIDSIDLIPYLPISAFKHHKVVTGKFEWQDLFKSSGTTQSTRSTHHIKDLSFYLDNTEYIWNQHFAPVENYCYLALLPGYLERDGSSLISMVNHFIAKSKYDESGFYLRNHSSLNEALHNSKAKNIPTVLFGVTHALLDFAEHYNISFPELIIIETGGMKGQKKEITKKELHEILTKAFKVNTIYSEYGMTELLSQAYSSQNGIFKQNRSLKIIIKQINDPLENEKIGKAGIISCIDLANIDSCAFIQTEDIGIVHQARSFEILGRQDIADARGCNLMVTDI